MYTEKRRGGWTARYRTPDGRLHQTPRQPTRAAALAAAAEAGSDSRRIGVFREGNGDDAYFVGRYRTPDGRWNETEDGFDTADDALDEARELEQAARASSRSDA